MVVPNYFIFSTNYTHNDRIVTVYLNNKQTAILEMVCALMITVIYFLVAILDDCT